MKIAPPPTAEKEHSHTEHHGHKRTDEYGWMLLSEAQRAAARSDAPTERVKAHLQRENAYTDSILKPLAKLRAKLFAEMRARVKEDDVSVPYRENGFWYAYRFQKGGEYPVHMRAKVVNDPERVPKKFTDFLDEDAMAKGHDYFDLGDFEIAPGNRIMAYSVDTVGRRLYTTRFRDLQTGKDLPDIIADAAEGGAFADDKTFFYVRKDRSLRNARVYRHLLGQPASEDVEVFHEKNRAFSCDVFRSRSDKFLIISTESTLSSEHLLLPVNKPKGEFKALFPRARKHEFSVMHVAATPGKPGKFYIHTNWKARNFRLMVCGERNTAKDAWKEVVPHREDVLLEDVDVFRDHLVLTERKLGLVQMRVRTLSTGKERMIDFNDAAYVAFSGVNPEWGTGLFRYGYTSLTTPTSIFEQNLKTGVTKMLKQQEVQGSFTPAKYVSERVWATAKDGTQVPISIVRRRDTPLNGKSPMLLYGYGAYGINVEPVFSSARLSLLDRGFVYAMAHVRGGEELGRHWYEEGRMEHKTNTFTDFIACAEHLIADGHADPTHLACMGGSAGGLLVGAVANMRPDLWNAVVAEVPFVDIIGTMMDASLPLTTGEYDEWGDPRESVAYHRMLAYSPYENVHDANYPAVLAITGFHDSQVQFWEPAKWVARLREHQRGENPVMLWANMGAGHGGATGRFEPLKEVAMIYAFLLERAGLAGRKPR
ncbi:MAG: S9 family peptidase [Flavobacteriales bacterium]|jgi:oligopeptidase B|nr:S9 family peptidase [Flavobacteriales bacterium]